MADYSGVVGLAQSVLAINMAYLALERFRYQKKIEQICAQADDIVSGMPEDYRNDLAWKNIRVLASDSNWKSLRSRKISSFFKRLFSVGVDRFVSYLFSIFALLLLIIQSFDALISDTNITLIVGNATGTSDSFVSWFIFLTLSFGALVPGGFVAAGWHLESCVTKLVGESLLHLGERFKEEAGGDVSEQIRRMFPNVEN